MAPRLRPAGSHTQILLWGWASGDGDDFPCPQNLDQAHRNCSGESRPSGLPGSQRFLLCPPPHCRPKTYHTSLKVAWDLNTGIFVTVSVGDLTEVKGQTR